MSKDENLDNELLNELPHEGWAGCHVMVDTDGVLPVPVSLLVSEELSSVFYLDKSQVLSSRPKRNHIRIPLK